MRLRSAVSLSAACLLVGVSGCTDEGYKATDTSTRLVVSPSYLGIIPPAAPVQYEATIGGAPVAVTWESSDPAFATVSPTGLVTAVDYGFTAITATLTADPSKKKSASLTVKPPGNTLQSGVGKLVDDGVGGAAGSVDVGDYLLYHIFVPAGATNLTYAISGGSGDLDLHVKFGSPPTLAVFDCRPYLGGNNETCNFVNPAEGFWFALLDVYADAGGATLTATITAP